MCVTRGILCNFLKRCFYNIKSRNTTIHVCIMFRKYFWHLSREIGKVNFMSGKGGGGQREREEVEEREGEREMFELPTQS